MKKLFEAIVLLIANNLPRLNMFSGSVERA